MQNARVWPYFRCVNAIIRRAIFLRSIINSEVAYCIVPNPLQVGVSFSGAVTSFCDFIVSESYRAVSLSPAAKDPVWKQPMQSLSECK